MADKISKFKQALRAQRTQPAEVSAFAKEIHKYKHTKNEQPVQVSSPKHDESARGKSADIRSNTANTKQNVKKPTERKAPHNHDNSGIKGELNTKENKTSSLRLSIHARSSKLIQRKDQPSKRTGANNELSKEHKPGGDARNAKTKANSPQVELDDSKTPSPTNKNKDESLNYFKNIATSIHKQILSTELRVANPLAQELISKSESSSQTTTDIIEGAKREAESMEITEHLSQEIKQLVGTVGEICESEGASRKVPYPPIVKKRKATPFSLCNPLQNEPASPLFSGSSTLLDTRYESTSYSLDPFFDSYEGPMVPVRQHLYQHSESPRVHKELANNTPRPLSPWQQHTPSPVACHFPSPLVHRTPSPLVNHTPTSPVEFRSQPSLDLFDSHPSDFFGFSQTRESFSNMGSRKLFSECIYK